MALLFSSVMGCFSLRPLGDWLPKEMGGLRMSKLIEQLKFSLAIFGAKIKPGQARSSGPDIDHILYILEQKCFLTLAEQSHVHVVLKLAVMVKV